MRAIASVRIVSFSIRVLAASSWISLSARSPVPCTQDGALGDTVKIQPADKSRELAARVLGRGLVAIEL